MKVDIHSDVTINVVHSSGGDITALRLERDALRGSGLQISEKITVYMSPIERERLIAALRGES